MKQIFLFFLILPVIPALAGQRQSGGGSEAGIAGPQGPLESGQMELDQAIRRLWPPASRRKTGRELLETGISSPDSLLIRAAIRGSAQDIKKSLQKGGDPAWADPESQTSLLHLAVDNPNPGVAKALLQAGARPMAVDENGETALHWAARNKKTPSDFFTELLKRGGRPRVESDRGETALMIAVKASNLQFLKAFRDSGRRMTPRERGVFIVFRCMNFFL